MAQREPKPAWSEVPEAVRSEAERRLGSRVASARLSFNTLLAARVKDPMPAPASSNTAFVRFTNRPAMNSAILNGVMN